MQVMNVSKPVPATPFGIASGLGSRRHVQNQKSLLINPSTKRLVHTHVAEVAAPTATGSVPPAILPDVHSDIPPARLIELAKKVFATQTGVYDESVLADDFKFAFPVIKLEKDAYLKAVRSFQLNDAIPDLNANASNWIVDEFEPNRVWFMIRTTGTHTGTLKFGSKEYPATGKIVQGAPECCSYTFDKYGKVTSFTGGYVADNRLGNTGGLGAIFGILTALNFKIPRPGTLAFTLAVTLNKIFTFFKNLFGGAKKE